MNKELTTSLYEKRDDFPFKIVNSPDLSGNVPHAAYAPAFGMCEDTAPHHHCAITAPQLHHRRTTTAALPQHHDTIIAL